MRFVFGGANIQNTPDIARELVRRAARIVRRQAPDVVAFQEIREAEDVVDVRTGLGVLFRLVCASVSTPIAFRLLKWALVDKGTIKLHDGDASIPTPTRWIAWVALRRRFRRNPIKTMFVGTHFINQQHPGSGQERDDLWDISAEKMEAFLAQAYDAGYNIFVEGDFNKLDFPLFHHAQVFIDDHGIDKTLAVLQPDVEMKIHRRWTVETPSDHDATFTEVELYRVS